ncbi:response regulator [Cohnella terricola]|uniref:Response regulator n=1 Tax=Cohnella terricola TaxID=1289167 RepID=A0A559JXG2_9BACL|nr:response regulator [Cohnella terricola]TVY04500.1 response regulator [Cohnella terricola]
MRAILVDDESLALMDLQRQLGKIGGIEIVGMFQNAEDALGKIGDIKPDVAFLDIEMPEISGLEAAERFHKLDDGIEIVFVTAYEDYAIKAFELAALDYVLKPINSDRLIRTVERLKRRASIPTGEAEEEAPAATVSCFQRLNIEYGKGEPFSWRTVRAQELFAYMVYKRNQPVRKDILLELLWPNSDYKKAYTQLYTTVYQIRKSLESAGLSIRLTNSGSDYYLDLGDNRCDVHDWENDRLSLPELTPDTAEEHMRWLRAYKGDYLSENNYSWAENERQRLRDMWYNHAIEVEEMRKVSGYPKESLELYGLMETWFPYTEEVYFLAMKYYAANGDAGAAKLKYDQLCSMLEEEYGIQPSITVRQWRDSL